MKRVILMLLLIAACSSDPPITEGTVVNREFKAAHWESGYRSEPRYGYHCGIGYDGEYGCGMKHYTEQVYEERHTYIEDRYRLQLKSCEEDKCRTGWITVPEDEYGDYRVGDRYPRLR